MSGWRIVADVVDIAIVAFIIYHLLLLLRGRRAMGMLLSLFAIVAIGFVAGWLKLDALNWLMSGLRGIWAIIFVVLFQEELRRMLGQVGQSRLFRPFVKLEQEEAIDTIVSAVSAMSSRKIGCLVAIEREARLTNYHQTGVLLNAPCVAPLLVSLFTPPGPLHDGAAVVNGNQIVAARCTLPLSQNQYYVRTLGTRHRAAVGLTEETDAVVVVVSAETGEISLAVDGDISTGLAVVGLRERLTQLLGPAQPTAQP